MKVRPAALITRTTNGQTEVLLMHYQYGGHDVYALPGGNCDRGETLPETIRRELREELGIEVTVQDALFFGEMLLSERKEDVLHVIFAADISEGTPVLNPAETSALAIEWINAERLERLNLYPNVGDHIKRFAFLWSAAPIGYVGRIEQQHFG
ncbi:NUDIX domain-containing protein [Spirosoma montaniterrae]|uniref:NUDIX hydrolase n=1 Tax=Spirosoma montaniterrae TaxID=1178516 RepID=A0A1P9X2B5_9BACT|nr:NUDIX hydrolase [Spirosoma montaniterrae]AQG81761.1 NUDIX hydrolase [Spirosoma montaniterrae]